jgi:hypothetical protein
LRIPSGDVEVRCCGPERRLRRQQYIAAVAGGEQRIRGAVLYQPTAIVTVFGL